jgi:hypothetical protein
MMQNASNNVTRKKFSLCLQNGLFDSGFHPSYIQGMHSSHDCPSAAHSNKFRQDYGLGRRITDGKYYVHHLNMGQGYARFLPSADSKAVYQKA